MVLFDLILSITKSKVDEPNLTLVSKYYTAPTKFLCSFIIFRRYKTRFSSFKEKESIAVTGCDAKAMQLNLFLPKFSIYIQDSVVLF